MKFLFTHIIIVFSLLSFQGIHAQNIVTPDDLKLISGDWKGELTYIDYGTGKPFTMPAKATVKKGKNENQVHMLISYPNEPNANSKENITISKDGFLLNKNKVVLRQILPDQEVKIITEYFGKDNKEKLL